MDSRLTAMLMGFFLGASAGGHSERRSNAIFFYSVNSPWREDSKSMTICISAIIKAL